MKIMPYRPFLLFFAMLAGACQHRPTPASDAAALVSSGQMPPQEFLDFYEKFHRDSLFQMAHVQWPLAGEVSPSVIDSVGTKKEQRLWQQENWRMHRPIELSGANFKREWQLLGEVMVIERIRESTTGMFLERRFAKSTEGEWELVFYSDF